VTAIARLTGDRARRHAKIIADVRRAEHGPRPTHPVNTVETTDRRDEILAFIGAFRAEHGYSPSVRQIGAAVELVSPSSVAFQLRQLETAGRIRATPGVPHSIVLVEPEPAADAADALACPTCNGTGKAAS